MGAGPGGGATAVVVAEEAAEAVETEVVPTPTTPIVPVEVPAKGPATGVPDTQTSLRASGPDAPCISDSGKGLTFVQSPPPAPGRMFSPRDLQNETGTSSASK